MKAESWHSWSRVKVFSRVQNSQNPLCCALLLTRVTHSSLGSSRLFPLFPPAFGWARINHLSPLFPGTLPSPHPSLSPWRFPWLIWDLAVCCLSFKLKLRVPLAAQWSTTARRWAKVQAENPKRCKSLFVHLLGDVKLYAAASLK